MPGKPLQNLFGVLKNHLKNRMPIFGKFAPRISLDEPFAGISNAYHKSIMEFIQQCAESGPAILCIDHLYNSTKSLYRQIHTWPSPVDSPNCSAPNVNTDYGFPSNSLTDLNIPMTAVSWKLRCVQVNSTLIASDFQLTMDPGTKHLKPANAAALGSPLTR
jgi:hypothetical protein